MKEKEEKMHFPKIDDFFTTQEERDAEKLEKVEKIAVSSISNFPNHPYQVKENEEMEKEIFDIKHEMLTMQSELDKANEQIKKLAEERQAAKDQVIRLETELGRNKHR